MTDEIQSIGISAEELRLQAIVKNVDDLKKITSIMANEIDDIHTRLYKLEHFYIPLENDDD